MNPRHVIAFILCFVVWSQAISLAQEIDKELSDLAEKLAVPIKDHGKKKIAVADFTDLKGASSELGKYIAEQLTVNLVMGKRDFSVLDRANLKRILAEHKLTSQGLIDPENAKKLGMFAGVDALVLGTFIPKTQSISLTAKIITTDTAEIVGAARAEFKRDATVEQLMSNAVTEVNLGGTGPGPDTDTAKVVKSFGDLRVEAHSLRMVNGNQLLLTMVVTNQSPKKSIWVAISTDMNGATKALITDSNGSEFHVGRMGASGIELGTFARYGYEPNTFSPATEIAPHDSISCTVKFMSYDQRSPASGACRVQIEFLMGRNAHDRIASSVTFHNFTGQMESE
jgi:curli biogenesis system outer membrane secretion channel CsgG